VVLGEEGEAIPTPNRHAVKGGQAKSSLSARAEKGRLKKRNLYTEAGRKIGKRLTDGV